MFGLKRKRLTKKQLKDNPLSAAGAAQKLGDAKKRKQSQLDRIAKEAGWKN